MIIASPSNPFPRSRGAELYASRLAFAGGPEGVATERHRWEVEDCRGKCRGSGNMTLSRILHSAAAAIEPHSAAVTKSAIMIKPPRGLRIGPLLSAGAGLGRRID